MSGLEIPSTLNTFITGRTISQVWTHATTAVGIANMTWLFALFTFWNSHNWRGMIDIRTGVNFLDKNWWSPWYDSFDLDGRCEDNNMSKNLLTKTTEFWKPIEVFLATVTLASSYPEFAGTLPRNEVANLREGSASIAFTRGTSIFCEPPVFVLWKSFKLKIALIKIQEISRASKRALNWYNWKSFCQDPKF